MTNDIDTKDGVRIAAKLGATGLLLVGAGFFLPRFLTQQQLQGTLLSGSVGTIGMGLIAAGSGVVFLAGVAGPGWPIIASLLRRHGGGPAAIMMIVVAAVLAVCLAALVFMEGSQ